MVIKNGKELGVKKSFNVGDEVFIAAKHHSANYVPMKGTIGGLKSCLPLRDKFSYYVFYSGVAASMHDERIHMCEILHRVNLIRRWFPEEEVFSNYVECLAFCNSKNSQNIYSVAK